MGLEKKAALPGAVTQRIDALVEASGRDGFRSEQLAEGLAPLLRERPALMGQMGVSPDPEVLAYLAACIAVDEWERVNIENHGVGSSLMLRWLRHQRWPGRPSRDFEPD